MLNWFSREIVGQSEGEQIILRPLTFEPDTVRELGKLIEDRLGSAELRHDPVAGHDSEEIPTVGFGSFTELPDWQLQGLTLSGPGINVSLRGDRIPRISYRPDAAEKASAQEMGREPRYVEGVVRDVITIMREQGRRRIERVVLRRVEQAVGAFLVIAAWVWVLLAERPGLSVVVAGSLAALIAVAVVAYGIGRFQRMYRPDPITGHRIGWKSRAELRQHRWDRRRDIWTGIIGAVVGALATALVTILVG